jgi:stearoyl-CoA desaturase (Delta-9 desaturase)
MVAPDPGDTTVDGCEEHTMNDAVVRSPSEPAPLVRRVPVTGTSSRGARPHHQSAVVAAEEPGAFLDDNVCWSTVAGLSLIHVASIAGCLWIVVHPSAATLALAGVMYLLVGFAITAGYHRLFAHRTYRASPAVRWAMLAFGAAAFQNSALSWSADHRAHHANTDRATDPHAVTRGVWFAHVGWLFHRRVASAHVRRLDDLWPVRSIRWQHHWYPAVAIAIGLIAPMAVAATWGDPWGGLLVAGFLRTGIMLQATFCINSLAHLVGTRRYDQRSSARDSTLTALVTFGEGYHNFHHRFPFDYRNGIRWWHYDPGKWLIWTMAHLRLITTVRSASQSTIARAAAATAPRYDVQPHSS